MKRVLPPGLASLASVAGAILACWPSSAGANGCQTSHCFCDAGKVDAVLHVDVTAPRADGFVGRVTKLDSTTATTAVGTVRVGSEISVNLVSDTNYLHGVPSGGYPALVGRKALIGLIRRRAIIVEVFGDSGKVRCEELDIAPEVASAGMLMDDCDAVLQQQGFAGDCGGCGCQDLRASRPACAGVLALLLGAAVARRLRRRGREAKDGLLTRV